MPTSPIPKQTLRETALETATVPRPKVKIGAPEESEQLNRALRGTHDAVDSILSFVNGTFGPPPAIKTITPNPSPNAPTQSSLQVAAPSQDLYLRKGLNVTENVKVGGTARVGTFVGTVSNKVTDAIFTGAQLASSSGTLDSSIGAYAHPFYTGVIQPDGTANYIRTWAYRHAAGTTGSTTDMYVQRLATAGPRGFIGFYSSAGIKAAVGIGLGYDGGSSLSAEPPLPQLFVDGATGDVTANKLIGTSAVATTNLTASTGSITTLTVNNITINTLATGAFSGTFTSTAGFKQSVGPWTRIIDAGTASDVQMQFAFNGTFSGSTYTNQWIAPFAGSIIGISGAADHGGTNVISTLYCRINGVTKLSATGASGTVAPIRATASKGTYAFGAGDFVTMFVTFNSTVAAKWYSGFLTVEMAG